MKLLSESRASWIGGDARRFFGGGAKLPGVWGCAPMFTLEAASCPLDDAGGYVCQREEMRAGGSRPARKPEASRAGGAGLNLFLGHIRTAMNSVVARRLFWGSSMTARVSVFGLSNSGLFCVSISLKGWPRARVQLQGCEVYSAKLEGCLAEGVQLADADCPLLLPPSRGNTEMMERRRRD